jgi:hypothetical protein
MEKRFEPVLDEQDKAWSAQKFIGLLVVTLLVAFAIILGAAYSSTGR